jgi:pyruvate-formate lyase-activating enzyme
MAVAAVLTPSIDPTRKGALLTFIVPSFGGCGMSCAHCFITQRDEQVEKSVLNPSDYAAFIRSAASTRTIAAVTVQGHEPLDPASLPWTEAILATGRDVGAETGLVTNGLYLADSIEILKRFGCGGVTVSIDADSAAQHDRLRGRPGAWQNAMNGLALAMKELPDAVIVVNSVLFTGRAERLAALPGTLAKIGVRRWSVSSLLRFRRHGIATVHGAPAQIHRDMAYLSAAAAAAGIEFYAEDEFSLLQASYADKSLGNDMLPNITVRTLSRPEGLLRLTPDGKCAFGLGVLRVDHQQSLVWNPESDVPTFLDGRLQGQGQLQAA